MISDKVCGCSLFVISLGFFGYLLYCESPVAIIALLGIFMGAVFMVAGVREFLERVRVIGPVGLKMGAPAVTHERPYFEESEPGDPELAKIIAEKKDPKEIENIILERLEKDPDNIELLSALIDHFLER